MTNLRRCMYMIICCFTFFLSAAHASVTLQFTAQEQAFLSEHKEIRIGIDPKFVPFEFLNDAQVHSGIAAEVLALVAERTGLNFTYNPNLSWTETVQLTRDGSIDLLSAVGYTESRAQYLTYLRPYLQFQRAIVVQSTNTGITGFSDLRGRQVAVQHDSSHEGFLLEYPDISLRRYETVQEALLAVSQGAEVAFVGNEATSVYVGRTLGLTELKIIPIQENNHLALHMAVRSELPVLTGIIQKALDSITESEYAQIFDRWIRYETKIDYTPIIRIVTSIIIVSLLVLAISLYWVMRLKKEIQQKEEAQRRAENADIEKSRYLARISHEIRTPLNGIKGMSYLLEKTSLDSTQSRYVQTIANASQTMQNIINDILEFSRLDEDRITLEQVPFTLDEVLENCISIESYLLRQKGLELKLTQEDAIPQFLIGDPTRLSQILINLINNAVKFTEEGSVEVSVVAKPLDEQSYRFTFTITDTGIGMDEEQLTSLFIPFVQANEAIHRIYGGSGLGLSIVKGLVEKMGGTINVESTLHKGSSFIVNLPLALDHSGMAKDQERRKSIDFSHLNVLLLISDRILSERVEALLTKYCIRFDGVTNPKLAKTILKVAVSYDLVILEMPKLNAIDEDLELELKNRNQKVLVMIHDQRHTEVAEGFDMVVPLPLINSVLFNALLQLFGKESEKQQKLPKQVLQQTRLPLHILVVEDNPTNQLIAKELLTGAGFTITLAGNGKEGYELFCTLEEDIDVVLMDLHMDVMDGYESSSLIRKKNEKVPIIVTSADIMDSVKTRCMETGVTDLIAKPYNPDMLIEKIGEYGFPYFNQRKKISAIDTKLGIRQVGGDAKVYSHLLTTFLSEMKALVVDLQTARQNQENDAIAELVHRSKGSCGAIGAIKAQKLCITVQNNPQDPTVLQQLLLQLELVIKEAERLLLHQETGEQS